MRAVSLSDDRVISLLNSSFVPVFTSNEDFRDNGGAPKEERELLQQIHRDGHAKGLSVGSVHAYVISPAGRVTDSLHTVEVAKPAKLIAMLQNAESSLTIRPGQPVVPVRSGGIQCPPGAALTLHVTSRYLERKGNELVLVENAGGNWSALPGEDFIPFSKAEVRGFLSPAPRIGTEWSLPRSTSDKLLVRFYPPTENNDPAKSKITESETTCRVLSSRNGVSRVGILGKFKMKHPFYHRDDDWFVSAAFSGYYDLDVKRAQVTRFRLATESAEYCNGSQSRLPFGVAVRSIP